ncbi:MAG TPA: histidine--tRNA ligase [Gemmataceae bacterium]|nr:histidine--tRNA ligase [Gemmataceae bacterium]
MADLIQPRTLKGFRDYLPELMIPREQLLDKARRVYRSYGFAPIDTPALEYTEILMGKGGEESDRLIYRFTDHGGRDVALRFDLTIPFARFAAQYIGQLGTPFKRYHMGPVWRGENTAHGRYREFWQCDFDTIGTTSNAADIETALVIHDLMVALGFERFQVRLNNRLVLNGLLEELGLAGQAVKLLRVLDKLPKIGREKVRDEMTTLAEGESGPVVFHDRAERILALAETEGTNADILDRLQRDFGSNARAAEGIARLRELLDVAKTAGIPEERLRLDLSIARGLDYYTGTIYETFLLDKPDIGSVCSGGRYDNLAGLYTKQKLPGVGASLGLDRLLAAMEEMNLLPKASTPAPVLVVQFSPVHLGEYQKMARALRAEGIGVEVFPEPKKVGQQLKYADQRGFKVALIAGSDEFAEGVWNVKDLKSATQREKVPAAQVAEVIREILQER